VNGACKDKDIAHMRKYLASSKLDAQLEVIEDATLMALQGPRAAEALKKLKAKVDLDKMAFMSGRDNVEIAGVNCRLTRCGYTGEDGFEISCEKDGPKVFDALLGQDFVQPCGLGARDSLRLEAGLCLYGHELDETILPVEASLTWVINKNRRTGDRANFLGSKQVLAQLSKDNAPKRKRVGFVVNGAPAREGAKVFSEGKEVGIITSGTFSPTLNKPIAMGYVPAALSANGTKLFAQVRGKDVPIVVEKMPFVSAKYFKAA
jgi:aminomethyltransferase